MSSDICFYKVTPSLFNAGSTIEFDDIGYERSYIRADGDIPDWAYDMPPVHVHCPSIDMFATGEALFGKRPTSISMNSWDLSEHFHFADGTEEEIKRDDLVDYYYDDDFDAYVYDREIVGIIENSYLINDYRSLDNVRITNAMAGDLLQNYINENREYLEDEYAGSYYLRPVYILAKLMFEADNAVIVCEVN